MEEQEQEIIPTAAVPHPHGDLLLLTQSPFACVVALCYVPGTKSAGGCMADCTPS
jgi:hypothetical protein